MLEIDDLPIFNNFYSDDENSNMEENANMEKKTVDVTLYCIIKRHC